MRKNKVLFLTRYSSIGASSRVRFYQFIPWLSKDYELHCQELFGDSYLKSLYQKNNRDISVVFFSYIRRLIFLLRELGKFDVVVVEKELFPYIPAFFETYLLRKSPFILDYDDATMHVYDKSKSKIILYFLKDKIKILMNSASANVVGNSYLYEYAISSGVNPVKLQKIPSVVDIARYPRGVIRKNVPAKCVIGWIGSPGSQRVLLPMVALLKELTLTHNVKVVLVGAKEIDGYADCFEYTNWTLESEVEILSQFDIGIMPLQDEPFQHGKCAYKIIQYMAAGLPVVCSPVGVNVEIVKNGVNGFKAVGQVEWREFLRLLVDDLRLRDTLGKKGRELVEDNFTLEYAGEHLHRVLARVANSDDNKISDDFSN